MYMYAEVFMRFPLVAAWRRYLEKELERGSSDIVFLRLDEAGHLLNDDPRL